MTPPPADAPRPTPGGVPLSEDDLLRRVIDTATLYGWRVCHFRPTQKRNGKWSTPIQGHPGMPDLVLARAGTVILAELKSDTGRVEPEQREWLRQAGPHGRVWRPRDWPSIWDELNRS